MYFNAYLTCVFKGHVRDWRQKIQRAKGETGKVGNFDHSSSCFNIKKEDVELIVSIQKCLTMRDSQTCLF